MTAPGAEYERVMKRTALPTAIALCATIFTGCGDLSTAGGDLGTRSYGMKFIAGGTFLMGADSMSRTVGTVNYLGDSIHPVVLSDFYLDSTEVTQSEFRRLMHVNPSYFNDSSDGALRPAENMTWFDAVLYCNARSRSEGRDTVYSYASVDGVPGNGCAGLGGLSADFSKKGYRLPTEAEWEYACKGGAMTNYWWGNDIKGASASAWWYMNCNGTKPVATRAANAYGLYDMVGNVFEWCNDWYGSFGSGEVTDPIGATDGRSRILRGSAWYYFEYRMRSTDRHRLNPDARFSIYGFRCARR